MQYQFVGDAMQALLFNLEPGEEIVAEPGAMLFCNEAIQFESRQQGGLLGGIKRAVTGESLFLTHFQCIAPGGTIAFGATHPGKIEVVELTGNEWLCQRNSFLCATAGIVHEVAWTHRFGAGPFASEGFILQRAAGQGTVFLHIGGSVLESQLQAGQALRVDPGCIAALEPTVHYDIHFLGGFRNMLFGGEGMSLATLTGPGKVMLQTLPLSRLAGRVATANAGSAMAGGTATGTAAAGTAAGSGVPATVGNTSLAGASGFATSDVGRIFGGQSSGH
jgi:uncharacterized protein (TIGR00266 family)